MTLEEIENRFCVELEFLCCLSNPRYLLYLSQANYLSDPSFIRFLQYLEYFEQFPYRKYVIYPHAFFFRKALLSAEFRELINSDFCNNYINAKQYFYYMHQSYRRIKHIQDELEKKEEISPKIT
eukprot:NODE_285_length_10753_cov_0.438615.p9 type:complete len:124 gc:universal NODE_285_length_10753_cov_0.438615:5332-5703(+)